MSGRDGGTRPLAARNAGPSTSADVARLAGVSIGTVSHVVSGAKYVRPETRRRVERAINELQFEPNRVAQSLISRRTKTVGMVVPDIANPYFAELMRGAEDCLAEQDYAVLLGSSDHDPSKEHRYYTNLAGRRVDGLITAPSAAVTGADLSALRQFGPVVLVVETVAGWDGDAILGDDASAITQVVRHLAELGHRRIGMIGGNASLSSARRRESFFRASMADAGLTPVQITSGAYTVESGRAQAAVLLSRPDRPTAICAGNDLLALGALAEADRRGLRVPSELSVVGCDDIPYAELSRPPLTTVALLASEIGRRAARLVLDRLSGNDDGPSIELVDAELIVRGSTALALSTEVSKGR
jgi:LacI family transcriptional regulator